MGFSMEFQQGDTQLWVNLYPAKRAYRTCIAGNSVKIKEENKSQTAASSTHMAFTTGISRTQLESSKHEWSCGHYNWKCNSAYSEYCLRFMMLLHAPLLSAHLVFPGAVQVKVSAQIQVPPAAVEDQDLDFRSLALLYPGGGAGVPQPCWAQHWSPNTFLHTNTVARAIWGFTLCRPVVVQHHEQAEGSGSSVVGKVRSFLRLLSKALSTHIATWAGCWVPGLGPCCSCKGKMF